MTSRRLVSSQDSSEATEGVVLRSLDLLKGWDALHHSPQPAPPGYVLVIGILMDPMLVEYFIKPMERMMELMS